MALLDETYPQYRVTLQRLHRFKFKRTRGSSSLHTLQDAAIGKMSCVGMFRRKGSGSPPPIRVKSASINQKVSAQGPFVESQRLWTYFVKPRQRTRSLLHKNSFLEGLNESMSTFAISFLVRAWL